MASKKNVTASEVRAWARENLSSIPVAGHASVMGKDGTGERVRGRLNPVVVAAFNKANKSKTYAEKVAESRTVEFTVPAQDKRGRNISRKVTITTDEARTLLGHEKGKKGRFSKSALAEAYAATM